MSSEPAPWVHGQQPMGIAMLLCVVKGASDGAGRPVMGHSVEGRLLLGQAVPGEVCRAAGRQIVRRTTAGGVGQLLGQARRPDRGQSRGRWW